MLLVAGVDKGFALVALAVRLVEDRVDSFVLSSLLLLLWKDSELLDVKEIDVRLALVALSVFLIEEETTRGSRLDATETVETLEEVGWSELVLIVDETLMLVALAVLLDKERVEESF